MTGMNRFDGKDRRRQRLRNHIAKDLASPKYRQRTVPNKKRYDNDDGSYYFDEQYEDDEEYFR